MRKNDYSKHQGKVLLTQLNWITERMKENLGYQLDCIKERSDESYMVAINQQQEYIRVLRILQKELDLLAINFEQELIFAEYHLDRLKTSEKYVKTACWTEDPRFIE